MTDRALTAIALVLVAAVVGLIAHTQLHPESNLFLLYVVAIALCCAALALIWLRERLKQTTQQKQRSEFVVISPSKVYGPGFKSSSDGDRQ